MWQAGAGLVAAAGAWTSWDLLRPGEASGFGGKVRAIPPESLTDAGVTVSEVERPDRNHFDVVFDVVPDLVDVLELLMG